MNKNWLKLIGFPCGFVILWWGLQTTLLHGLRNYSTGKFGVWNKAVEGKINAQILFAGSSRTWVHFDPRVIEAQTGRSAYNIGRDGTLPDLQLAFLTMYLRHNQKPELLVQGLDIMMFCSSEKVYAPWQYLPFLQEPEIYQSVCLIDPAFRGYRYAPLLGIFKTRLSDLAFRGLIDHPKKEKQFQGFEPKRMSWSGMMSKSHCQPLI